MTAFIQLEDNIINVDDISYLNNTFTPGCDVYLKGGLHLSTKKSSSEVFNLIDKAQTEDRRQAGYDAAEGARTERAHNGGLT